jgi:hypothetical protein
MNRQLFTIVACMAVLNTGKYVQGMDTEMLEGVNDLFEQKLLALQELPAIEVKLGAIDQDISAEQQAADTLVQSVVLSKKEEKTSSTTSAQTPVKTSWWSSFKKNWITGIPATVQSQLAQQTSADFWQADEVKKDVNAALRYHVAKKNVTEVTKIYQALKTMNIQVAAYIESPLNTDIYALCAKGQADYENAMVLSMHKYLAALKKLAAGKLVEDLFTELNGTAHIIADLQNLKALTQMANTQEDQYQTSITEDDMKIQALAKKEILDQYHAFSDLGKSVKALLEQKK